MTIKQLIPRMLLVMVLALTILVYAPSRVLSTDPEKSKAGQSHTESISDGKGGSEGTRTTTTGGGRTTVTEIYTVGPNAGTTITEKFGSTGFLTSETTKRPDGSIENKVFDASHASIVTTTRPDGTVKTETFNAPLGGPGSEKLTSVSLQTTHPNGTVATETIDPSTGKPTGLTLKDSKGNVTTTTPDGKGGFTAAVKSPDGKIETTTYDPSGKLTGLSLKDSKGNVTTALPDGKGGFASSVTEKNGKVATSSYDADGKLTGETTKDKNGKVISSTSTTYDANGGSTSVTKDKNGKVVSSTVYDKLGNVVSQTGKKQVMTLGTSGQPTGGTQTSQGSGKHKDKEHFQADVFHQAKEKQNDQSSSSPSGSSNPNPGQSHHHGRR
jgi:YD repeat-containing protein